MRDTTTTKYMQYMHHRTKKKLQSEYISIAQVEIRKYFQGIVIKDSCIYIITVVVVNVDLQLGWKN